MSIATSEIITKLRYLIRDPLLNLTDVFEYNTSSSEFSLSEPNVSSISTVYVNAAESGVLYDYDTVFNKIDITSSLSDGDIIEVDYSYYNRYTDTELLAYIENAMMQLDIRNYKSFLISGTNIYPEPVFTERNLIAVIASVLIDPQNIDYSLPDMTIKAAKGSVPTDVMIDRILYRFKNNTHGIFGTTEV